jgi:hypothetical protein
MKTTTNYDFSNLTDEQIKSIALLQHLGDSFFILDDKVFTGTMEEATEAYNGANCCQLSTLDLSECETEADQAKIYDWCIAELEQVEPYDEDDYNNNYIVLTDSEADDKAAEYIKDSLWAFNASFLASETGLDEEIFQAIQDNGRCESNNDIIYNTINKLGNMDEFIDAAISADGRGHFMSSYDGNENEETVNGEMFFIYRIN